VVEEKKEEVVEKNEETPAEEPKDKVNNENEVKETEPTPVEA